MPTSVSDYTARRFVLRFEDEGELYGLKFDVCILSRNDSEEWVEVFQAEEEDGGTEGNRLILSAPLSEVVELLEKILSFLQR